MISTSRYTFCKFTASNLLFSITLIATWNQKIRHCCVLFGLQPVCTENVGGETLFLDCILIFNTRLARNFSKHSSKVGDIFLLKKRVKVRLRRPLCACLEVLKKLYSRQEGSFEFFLRSIRTRFIFCTDTEKYRQKQTLSPNRSSVLVFMAQLSKSREFDKINKSV